MKERETLLSQGNTPTSIKAVINVRRAMRRGSDRLLRLAWFPLKVYAVLVLFGFLTGLFDYLYGYGHISLKPAQAFMLFVPLLGLMALQEVVRPKPFSNLFALLQSSAPVLFAFFLLVACGLVYSLHPTAYWYDDGKWIKLPSVSFGVFLVGLCLTSMRFYRESFRTAVVLGFYGLLLSLIAELFFPGQLFVAKARAAGFTENANLAAMSLVMLCAAALRYDLRYKLSETFFLLLCGLGVFMTLSRGGVVLFFALTAFYIYTVVFRSRGGLRKGAVLLFLLSAAGVTFLVVIPVLLQESEMFAKEGAQQRVDQLMGSRGFYEGDDSRIRALKHSLSLINEAPLFGHGTGYTRVMPVGPHNMYIQQWVNNGLPGALAFVLLLAVCYWLFHRRHNLPGQVLMLLAALGSLFSHNIIDHRFFLLLLGGQLGVSFYRYSKERQSRPVLLLEERHSGESGPAHSGAPLLKAPPRQPRYREFHTA